MDPKASRKWSKNRPRNVKIEPSGEGLKRAQASPQVPLKRARKGPPRVLQRVPPLTASRRSHVVLHYEVQQLQTVGGIAWPATGLALTVNWCMRVSVGAHGILHHNRSVPRCPLRRANVPRGLAFSAEFMDGVADRVHPGTRYVGVVREGPQIEFSERARPVRRRRGTAQSLRCSAAAGSPSSRRFAFRRRRDRPRASALGRTATPHARGGP